MKRFAWIILFVFLSTPVYATMVAQRYEFSQPDIGWTTNDRPFSGSPPALMGSFTIAFEPIPLNQNGYNSSYVLYDFELSLSYPRSEEWTSYSPELTELSVMNGRYDSDSQDIGGSYLIYWRLDTIQEINGGANFSFRFTDFINSSDIRVLSMWYRPDDSSDWQVNVLYDSLTVEAVGDPFVVPLPASLWFLGTSIPFIGFLRRSKRI